MLGSSFSHEFLKWELQNTCKWEGSMDLISLGRGFYSIKCSSAKERSRILAEGPWFIMGSLVWVQAWQSGFKPSKANISQYPIKVTLPELSLEFYWKDILQAIGNSMGSIIEIDAHTLEGDRQKYASLCVLMRANQKLPGKAWVGAISQDLTFFESSWVCNACRRVDHNLKRCPKTQGERKW